MRIVLTYKQDKHIWVGDPKENNWQKKTTKDITSENDERTPLFVKAVENFLLITTKQGLIKTDGELNYINYSKVLLPPSSSSDMIVRGQAATLEEKVYLAAWEGKKNRRVPLGLYYAGSDASTEMTKLGHSPTGLIEKYGGGLLFNQGTLLSSLDKNQRVTDLFNPWEGFKEEEISGQLLLTSLAAHGNIIAVADNRSYFYLYRGGEKGFTRIFESKEGSSLNKEERKLSLFSPAYSLSFMDFRQDLYLLAGLDFGRLLLFKIEGEEVAKMHQVSLMGGFDTTKTNLMEHLKVYCFGEQRHVLAPFRDIINHFVFQDGKLKMNQIYQPNPDDLITGCDIIG